MAAVAIEIADAVVTELNAAVLTQSFTAVRAYIPIYKLEEMNNLLVTVVPKSVEVVMATRERDDETHRVDVAVQKKLSDLTAAVIDPLMLLTEEIGDYMRRRPLTAYPAAHWIGIEHELIFHPTHLESQKQFTSVFTLLYQVTR